MQLVQPNPFKNNPTIVSHLHLFGWTWKTMSVYLHRYCGQIVAPHTTRNWSTSGYVDTYYLSKRKSPIWQAWDTPYTWSNFLPGLVKQEAILEVWGTIFNPKTVCESFTHTIRLIWDVYKVTRLSTGVTFLFYGQPAIVLCASCRWLKHHETSTPKPFLILRTSNQFRTSKQLLSLELFGTEMFLEICTLKHEEPGNLNILKHIELLMVPGTWNHQQRKPLDPVLSIAHGDWVSSPVPGTWWNETK